MESPDGFDKWLSVGAEMTRPGMLRMDIETRSSSIPVEYRREAQALTVGTLAIDMSKGNVAVVSLSNHGVVVRDEQAERLVFHRDRARSTPGVYDFYAEHTEVAAEIKEVRRRSAKLQDLVGPPVP